MFTRAIAAIALALPLAAPALAYERTAAPEGAEVYFVNVRDGDTVTSPFTVVFGARGVGIAPAGVEHPATGHHHLLIDVNVDEALLSQSLPSDDNHRHFGGGQTEFTLDLAPGEHTLQLLMGDHNHVPHDPPIMSEAITVTVAE